MRRNGSRFYLLRQGSGRSEVRAGHNVSILATMRCFLLLTRDESVVVVLRSTDFAFFPSEVKEWPLCVEAD